MKGNKILTLDGYDTTNTKIGDKFYSVKLSIYGVASIYVHHAKGNFAVGDKYFDLQNAIKERNRIRKLYNN